jgi:GH25 family lysozyme M1 (1,4-beta-N-acetylmuramidase)
MAGVASAGPVDGSSCTTWVHGIDVSNNQGSIDWGAVPSSGVAFAYLKATEGTWFRDGYLARNAAGASAAGIPWGTYDFARPRTDPVAEADFFVDNGGANGFLPPALDLEVTDGRSAYDVAQWAGAWTQEVIARLGRAPIIYIGAFFSDGSGHRVDASGLARYLNLWLPSYFGGVDPNPCRLGSPAVPSGFPGWSIWQYSSSTNVNGISGWVDANAATPQWYQAVTGVGSVPAPTDPGSPPPAVTGDAAWQVFRLGSIGPGVEKIQQTVGVTPDGKYGPSTVTAVQHWQATLGLRADGVWGTATQTATDDLFAYLDQVSAFERYLHLLAAQEAQTSAYLHGLAAAQGGPDAYLHQLAAQQAQFEAYLHTLAAQ